MAATQANKTIRVKSPFGADKLLFKEMHLREELGRLFQCDLSVRSPEGDLDPDRILGQSVTVEFELTTGGAIRYLNAVVTEFAQTGYSDELHEYEATLRPWLWLLTRTADCRIFQQKSVPDIVQAVFREYGLTDFELRLSGSYRTWEYCAQYRETDFNFVSRLLEHEGIYYFFEHSEDKHSLVLADDTSAHKTVSHYETVPFYPANGAVAFRERDHLNGWSQLASVQTGACALQDFDFEQPRKSLIAKSSIRSQYAHADFELFDYPGTYTEKSDGDDYAKVRIQELRAEQIVARAVGNAVGLQCGALFTLENHPREDQNHEYLITASTLYLKTNAYQSAATPGIDAQMSARCIDSKVVFRPMRSTPKPYISGTQSALIVGKSGEEIYTDQYGRVKLQFHWDRYSKGDENSSCWVRVTQLWAGKQWGAVHIPRIGQEVIVSFLEGDPDRPIVTGRVYNGDSMPPYALPDNKTQSGIKSRSSQSGTADNFNEIRFEDLKGQEMLTIHAEKDMTAEVENDRSETIGRDETAKVGRDQKWSVGHDSSLDVGNNETINITQDRSISVGGNESDNVGKQYTLTAGDQISLTTGSASIVMKSNGDIEISGNNITISGQSKVEIDGQQINVQGTQIQVQGTQTTVQSTLLNLNASGVASIQGSLTKIN